MVVKTNTPELREARKTVLELILSNHDKKCLTCVRSQNCELQKLCKDLGVENGDEYAGEMNHYDVDDVSPSIVRDNNKCVVCRRCVAACEKVQNVGVIGATKRGFKTCIASPWDMHLSEMACINCGQCITVCPVGALHEKDDTDLVWKYLGDKTKHVVVQPAPAVRAALGEEFGLPMLTALVMLAGMCPELALAEDLAHTYSDSVTVPQVKTEQEQTDTGEYDGLAVNNDHGLLHQHTVSATLLGNGLTDVCENKPVTFAQGDTQITDGTRSVLANYQVRYLSGAITVMRAASLTLRLTPYSGVYDAQTHAAGCGATVNGGKPAGSGWNK